MSLLLARGQSTPRPRVVDHTIQVLPVWACIARRGRERAPFDDDAALRRAARLFRTHGAAERRYRTSWTAPASAVPGSTRPSATSSAYSSPRCSITNRVCRSVALRSRPAQDRRGRRSWTPRPHREGPRVQPGCLMINMPGIDLPGVDTTSRQRCSDSNIGVRRACRDSAGGPVGNGAALGRGPRGLKRRRVGEEEAGFRLSRFCDVEAKLAGMKTIASVALGATAPLSMTLAQQGTATVMVAATDTRGSGGRRGQVAAARSGKRPPGRLPGGLAVLNPATILGDVRRGGKKNGGSMDTRGGKRQPHTG